jgi:hypothetical protein
VQGSRQSPNSEYLYPTFSVETAAGRPLAGDVVAG